MSLLGLPGGVAAGAHEEIVPEQLLLGGQVGGGGGHPVVPLLVGTEPLGQEREGGSQGRVGVAGGGVPPRAGREVLVSGRGHLQLVLLQRIGSQQRAL